MANIKSAKKRIRSSERKRRVNKANSSALRTELKSFRAALEQTDKKAASEQLGRLYEVIDRAVHKGILHRNAAARHKSRLTRRASKA